MDNLLHVSASSLALYTALVGLPLLGASINALFFRKSPLAGARFATAVLWVGWLITVIGLIRDAMGSGSVAVAGLQADALSWIMATLILFVSGIVHHFSLRYLAGDRQYHRYFVQLSLLTSAALLMVLADHILLLLVGWGISNLLLVRLMIHKSNWKAAYQSGILALRTFVFGFLLLGLALGLLANAAGSFSLHTILLTAPGSSSTIALLLLALAAMTQSALLPFHKWLLSSLNSPTPVSALMHAGLVNGGGFLLARFAPLYLPHTTLLHFLFAAGFVTAVVGTLWKLLQSDIKRMLACSTMSQMGFMVMQCGLGLFPAAVAHLCWHGLFKAFLFLSAGSTVHENRQPIQSRTTTPLLLALASLGGLAGAYGFARASGKPFIAPDTTAFLIGFAFMAGTQIAQTVLSRGKLAVRLIPAIGAALLAGLLYGVSVHSIESLLTGLAMSTPQPLTSLHGVAFGLILLTWLGVTLKPLFTFQTTRIWHWLYVSALNASQPAPDTTTPVRTAYQY